MAVVTISNEEDIPLKDKKGGAPLITKLLVGEEAFKVLSEPMFKLEWDLLYGTCAWCTVFQSREFVETWYDIYREEYLPIVVTATEDNHLAGLLTMALPRTCVDEQGILKRPGRIVGAGQYEAEYQCWLSGRVYAEEFIKKALQSIAGTFRGCDIHFRYLPSAIPLAWVQADPYWRNRLILQPATRPLMAMRSPQFSKLFTKPEFKNKVNRLKRHGKFRFEIVTQKSYFEEILPELVLQYDFRQGAMFNKNQFFENPLKIRFLLAVFDKGLLHVSVLKVNQKIMAAIVAVAGKGWVHLGGINTHAPYKAKFLSPGFVHFIMLGKHLATSGFEVFDLTPGGDAYKERLATDHDLVYEMILPGTVISKTKRLLKKNLFSRLVQAGKRPMSVELTLRKEVYLLKAHVRSMLNPKLALSKLLAKQRRPMQIRPDWNETADPMMGVQENDLKELLLYTPAKYDVSRWEFLETAMRRLEAGDTCYTWSKDGQLMACAWLVDLVVDSENTAPEKPFQLELTYCQTAARKQLPAFLAAISRLLQGEGLMPLFVRNLCRSGFALDKV
ncbi:GNAT family N-acetyltransferase [Pontibacter flavimaris]|uniref:BioF2-like acetyltransferase domain-containing protein n=1 Tax=Pontibacter flavimaris TaxID=1797110 RepID=A0A1Q5PBI5_9BACT|nr:GNAT family N-acetyltransferase [Pontibacter flavimaris]OKL39551.1 hypothetical protein A3841_00970 [Pontibacter flavimaris]